MEARIPNPQLEKLRRLRAQLDAWNARAGEARAQARFVELELKVTAQEVASQVRPGSAAFSLDLDRGTMNYDDEEGE